MRRLRPALVVLAVGVLVVAVLGVAAEDGQRDRERDLLRQRANEATTALGAVLPVFQLPLSSALAVAEETDGSAASFERVVGGFLAGGQLVTSASLWEVPESGPPTEAVALGEASELSTSPPQTIADELTDAPAGALDIIDLTSGPQRSLGIALAADATADSPRRVAYLEVRLPSDPTEINLTGDAFSDLDYAVYLDDPTRPSSILSATTDDLPLEGDVEQVSVPWGTATLQLLFVPRGDFSGGLQDELPWLIFGLGGVLVIAFAWLAHRLDVAIAEAGALARRNEELFLEQQGVARTLQRDLLPTSLPATASVSLAHRYQSGVDGIEVGGDWYDAVLVDDDQQLLFSVGDVSGRGLPAATVMMTLRTAIRAWASEGHDPATILGKLNRLLDVRTDGHFATILCGRLHLETGELALASAGHPAAILLGPDGVARRLAPEVGAPVGVADDGYESLHTVVEPESTLVAFTDGLFERRGEVIDVGFDRVTRAVTSLAGLPIEDLVERLMVELAAEAPDDTAVLAIRRSHA